MLYFTIISISVLIASLLNYFFNPMHLHFFVYTIAFLIGIAIVIMFAGLVALIVNLLPRKWFLNYNKKIYRVSDKRLKFYKKVNINKWKEKIPEWGAAGGFRKNKIYKPNDPEYLHEYIIEVCYGISCHILMPYVFLISFIITYLLERKYFPSSNLSMTVMLPCAIVGGILFYIPTMVLRFNLPKLIRLYEIKKKAK